MFVLERAPKSIEAEAYRSLRTNIEYSFFDKKSRVIMVTSSIPGEGKSTVAGNLAIALSQNNKLTLLVDCDLRRPTIHKKLGISGREGLTEFMIGEASLRDVIYEYSDNLDVLPCGKIPPNPSEMIASSRMDDFLNKCKEEYDYIIIDTPPVEAVTDSKILSTKVDAAVVVIKAESTKKEIVLRAINTLKRGGARILGTVLNSVKSKNGYYYYNKVGK